MQSRIGVAALQDWFRWEIPLQPCMIRVLGHVMSQTFNFHQMLFQFVLRCKGWAFGQGCLILDQKHFSSCLRVLLHADSGDAFYYIPISHQLTTYEISPMRIFFLRGVLLVPWYLCDFNLVRSFFCSASQIGFWWQNGIIYFCNKTITSFFSVQMAEARQELWLQSSELIHIKANWHGFLIPHLLALVNVLFIWHVLHELNHCGLLLIPQPAWHFSMN